MKYFILLTSLIFCTGIYAEDEILRPIGIFQYKSLVEVTKKRTAETVSHTSAQGIECIKNLKKIGFTCIRKNQINSICQKIESLQSTPTFVQKAVDDYLKNASISFAGTGMAEVVHDGASTEWLIREVVMIGSFKLDIYKLVKNNKGAWFAVFPVSEEQGIANVEVLTRNHIGLPLILETKEAAQTVAYFVTAHFINY